MSLETVVEDIRDEARARADEIRAAAEERAEQLIAEAEADADETLESAKRDVERQIEQEREQTLSSAKLEAKQLRLEARRDVLAEVRETVEAELGDLDPEKREELTSTLLEAALAEFDDDVDDVTVSGAEQDTDLLASLADEYDVEYAGEYDCLGGVVVESPSSRLRVNNTFDSLVESVWDDVLQEISTRLFDETDQ